MIRKKFSYIFYVLLAGGLTTLVFSYSKLSDNVLDWIILTPAVEESSNTTITQTKGNVIYQTNHYYQKDSPNDSHVPHVYPDPAKGSESVNEIDIPQVSSTSQNRKTPSSAQKYDIDKKIEIKNFANSYDNQNGGMKLNKYDAEKFADSWIKNCSHIDFQLFKDTYIKFYSADGMNKTKREAKRSALEYVGCNLN